MSNGEPHRRSSPAATVSAALAAFATGVVFFHYALANDVFLLGVEFLRGGNLTVALQPVAVVLAAALAVTVAGLLPALARRGGWAIAAAGLLLTMSVLQVDVAPTLAEKGSFAGALIPAVGDRPLAMLLAAGLGITLAGVLLGATAGGTAVRVATGLGLAAGFVMWRPVLELLLPLAQDPDALDIDLVLTASALVLALAALLAALLTKARPTTGTNPAGQHTDPTPTASDPQTVAPNPQAAASDPQAIAPNPQTITSDPQTITRNARTAASDPRAITPDLRAAGTGLRAAGSDAVDVRPRPSRLWGTAAAALTAALVLVAGRPLLRRVIDAVSGGGGGRATAADKAYADELAHLGPIVIAALTTLVLTVYAYRRGRADLARWPVLCFGLMPPLAYGLFTLDPTALPWTWPLVALGAAALGAAAAHRADRALPWDALGACLAGGGTIFVLYAIRERASWREAAVLVTVGGLAFALSAGLVRVLRAARGEPDRAAAAVLLGFAALLLAWPSGAVLSIQLLGHVTRDDQTGVVAGLTGAAAAMILVLFLYDRAAARARRTRPTDAVDPATPNPNPPPPEPPDNRPPPDPPTRPRAPGAERRAPKIGVSCRNLWLNLRF